MELNKIYCMDNVQGLRQLDDNCIDLTVTSPPYDNLRTYKGFSWNFEDLARELFRVTKKGGVVVWVVGDATINGSETGTSFKQALYFKDIGFNLHDTMIYLKENPVPLNHNRYEQCFEYMFVLSKGVPQTFNPIKTQSKYAFKKHDRTGCVSASMSQNGAMSGGAKKRIITTTQLKIIPNIWSYSVGLGNTSSDDIFSHPATFPEQLAQDHILSWSNEGDIILDPFMGSGTTAKMALKLNRKFIGFEIAQEYVDLANKRIKKWIEQERLF